MFKDLGTITNQHLSWNPHIDYVVSKANRMLGLIKRTCKGLDYTTTLRTLSLLSGDYNCLRKDTLRCIDTLTE